MGSKSSRRNLVLGAGASVIALASGRAALALEPRELLGQLLDQSLPQELRAVLPGGVFEAAGFVRQLLSLEGEAKALDLPQSALSRGDGAVPLDPERLYQAALPRLVALIDRAELRNTGFADKAGALLALLHRTQYSLPDAFRALVRAENDMVPVMAFNQGLQIEAEVAPPALPAPPVIVSEPVLQRLPDPPSPSLEGGPAIVDITDPALSDDLAPPTPAALPRISRSLRFADLAAEYQAWFKAAALRPLHAQSAQWHIAMLRQSRARYESASRRSGVPWYFIGAIHGLEASFNFRAHFHNGDHPLQARTRQVPAGRPTVWLPPSDWESSAIDALRLMGFAGQSDWSLARTLYRLEAYNGFGYRRLGRASPYLWSFSSNYDRGKFIADGRYSPTARSQQCGTAIMLKLLADAGEIALG